MSNVWSIVSNRLFPVTWGGTCRKDSFAFQPIGCGEDWCHHICHEAWLKQAIQRTFVWVASRHFQCTRSVMHHLVPSKHRLIQLNVIKKSLSDHPNCLIAPNHAKPSRMILRNHAAKLANALSEITNSDRTSHVRPCSAILLGDTNHELFTCWAISRSSAVLGASIQCDGQRLGFCHVSYDYVRVCPIHFVISIKADFEGSLFMVLAFVQLCCPCGFRDFGDEWSRLPHAKK